MDPIHAGLRAEAGHGAMPTDPESTEKDPRQDLFKALGQDENDSSASEESSLAVTEAAASMSRMATAESDYWSPEAGRFTTRSTSARLNMIVQDVAAYYKVSTCVATVFDDDGLCLESQWSSCCEVVPNKQELDSRGFNFFYHHTSRDLPIIIDDAVLYKGVCEHAIVTRAPYVRFYAGAPLIDGPGNYVGTLCIIDHLPKHGFSLMDADYLVTKAAEVTSILKAADRLGV